MAAMALVNESARHTVQALQYLRKLCSHPLLVLDASVDGHVRAVGQAIGQKPAIVKANWASSLAALHAAEHAPKMAALVELLQQCGILLASPDAAAATDGGVQSCSRPRSLLPCLSCIVETC